MSDRPHIPASVAGSVTHFICAKSPTRDGVPGATHHLAPRRSGRTAQGTASVQACTYCRRTEAELRAELD